MSDKERDELGVWEKCAEEIENGHPWIGAAAAGAIVRKHARAALAQQAVPHPGSPEASAAIDSELAAYGWPSKAKNAARAGYGACMKLMTTAPQAERQAHGVPAPDASRVAALLDAVIRQYPFKRGTKPYDDLHLARRIVCGYALPGDEPLAAQQAEQAPAVTHGPLTEEDITRALNLAYQFRSHPASRSIDEIEQAGELILLLLSAPQAEQRAGQAPAPGDCTQHANRREIIDALHAALNRHEAATDAMAATLAGDDPHAAALAGIELEKATALLSTWTQAEYLRVLIDCAAVQAPAVGDGLSPAQEPKYTVNGSAIVNRASGEAIPADEPVFIFRARDAHAMHALRDYLSRLPLGTSHRKSVEQRVMDFFDFKAAHPERMKEPDTEPVSHVPVQE